MKNALLALLVLGLTSCDYMMVTTIRNYRGDAKVNVLYDNRTSFHNGDTLHYQLLDNPLQSGFLARTNTSDSTYTFTIPANTEVSLVPIRLGNAIHGVEVLSGDSAIQYNAGANTKSLRKKGIIETKGFPFTHTIIINNR